jgi:hypothetical protein
MHATRNQREERMLEMRLEDAHEIEAPEVQAELFDAPVACRMVAPFSIRSAT